MKLKMSRLQLPLSVLALLVLWQVLVVGLDIPYYLLPTPTEVVKALWNGLTAPINETSSLLFQIGSTMRAMVLGFVGGGLLGILLGMIISESVALERVVMPYVFGMQSVPKIAIAPLLLIWFGFGLTSKAVLAGLLAFFPVLINTYAGMRMVDRDSLRLFRSLKARRWQVLWKLKLPNALPSILAGLDIAVVQSLLGAVVAEFISGKDGIGVAILQYQFINDTAGVFSALTVLALTGIILHWGVRTVEKKVLFWKASEEVKIGKEAA
jgi:NitT/TauT family transport system permease protein